VLFSICFCSLQNPVEDERRCMFTFRKFFVCLQCCWIAVARRQNHALNVESNSGPTIADAAGGPGAAWQKKTYLFCLNEVAQIKCDGEDQMMQVSSAVYNRNAKAGETECTPFESSWKSCKVDAKKMVETQCKATGVCHLIPSDHAVCDEEPFQQMRLVIKCRTAGPGETPRPEPARPGMEFTTTAPVVADEKKLVAADVPIIPEDHLEKISFTPCYRSLKVESVIDGDIESDSWRAQLASSVSSCGPKDGCFHLTFPDGVVYQDEDAEPTCEDLSKGELKEVGDNMWVTYEGIPWKATPDGTGIKRNDYNSWGICLPKTATLTSAVPLWKTMRTSCKK